MPTVSPCWTDSETFRSAQSVSSSGFSRRKSNVIMPLIRSRSVGLAWPSLYCFESFSTQIAALISRIDSPSRSASSNYVREAFLAVAEVKKTADEHNERQTDGNRYQLQIDGLVREQTGTETIHHPTAWIQSQYWPEPFWNHRHRINDVGCKQ